MERRLLTICTSKGRNIQSCYRRLHCEGRSIKVDRERSGRFSKHWLGHCLNGTIGTLSLMIRINCVFLKNSSITESSSFGVIRPILVLWWTTLKKWTFSTFKTLYLCFLIERKSHKEVKKLWQEIKVSSTSLKSTNQQLKTQIKRKINLKSKKITKSEKFKMSVLSFVMKTPLISKNHKKFFTCLEKQVRMNHWS